MLKTFAPNPLGYACCETANLETPNRRGHPRPNYYLSSIIPCCFFPKTQGYDRGGTTSTIKAIKKNVTWNIHEVYINDAHNR
jgi:hypothetical protein